MADSICSSSPISSKMESKTPVATQRRNRRYTVSHLPNTSGKSRQGAPVLQIQIIPSNDMRLSLPFLPGLPGPSGKIGSMRFHCRSLKVRITSNTGPLSTPRGYEVIVPMAGMIFIEDING